MTAKIRVENFAAKYLPITNHEVRGKRPCDFVLCDGGHRQAKPAHEAEQPPKYSASFLP